MLILSRRCREEIVIDDQIHVKVISTSGGRVKVGVSAPEDVLIRRYERPDGPGNDCLTLDCGPVLDSEPEAIAG